MPHMRSDPPSAVSTGSQLGQMVWVYGSDLPEWALAMGPLDETYKPSMLIVNNGMHRLRARDPSLSSSVAGRLYTG